MKDYILEESPEGNLSAQKSLISEIVIVLCILLFAYAAFSKLMDFANFRLQLESSPYISNSTTGLVWLIPGTELISACMMIFGRSRLFGLYMFTIMMAAFTIYIAFMLMFSNNTPCICGGIISGFSWFYHMIFNLGFLLLGISAIEVHSKNNDHPN